jgi:RNA polymerase sigma-70 factor (ECF subfamily)
MNHSQNLDGSGPFEARYLAFLETITNLRPSLHRYCSRMTGSVLDGEDVVQDALFEAYRKLDQYDERRPLKPWLFRIAHNRCIDLLRRRGVRVEAEAAVMGPDSLEPDDPAVLGIGGAVERLVISLPPKERACVLLKDIFDYTLEEIAELVGSTVGGVKAALNRGRSKLALAQEQGAPSAKSPEVERLLRLYVERFNRRDWEGVRELIAADARLRVADAFSGLVSKSPYFSNYDRFTVPWRLSVGEVDGEQVIIILQREEADRFTPRAVIRLDVVNDSITRITDYTHCPWILQPATSVVVSSSAN